GPSAWASRVDTDLLAFSTDVTPTLYALTGHRVAAEGGALGVPLVDSDDGGLRRRSQEASLIAASYRPGYGLLRDNGRYLYIIDAVNSAEHEYDLASGSNGMAIVATEEERKSAWREIRTELHAIARLYGVDEARP